MARPRSTSVSSGILIHPAVWPQQTWAENWGLCPFGVFEEGSWIPIQHNMAWAEAYLPTKWHLDPSNRLITIHQLTDRQTDRQTGQDRRDSTDNGQIAHGEPFYKRSPKNSDLLVLLLKYSVRLRCPTLRVHIHECNAFILMAPKQDDLIASSSLAIHLCWQIATPSLSRQRESPQMCRPLGLVPYNRRCISG